MINWQTVGIGGGLYIALSTNRVWKDKSGQRQSLPEYHNLVCWGRLAEFCGQYVRKGKPRAATAKSTSATAIL